MADTSLWKFFEEGRFNEITKEGSINIKNNNNKQKLMLGDIFTNSYRKASKGYWVFREVEIEWKSYVLEDKVLQV